MAGWVKIHRSMREHWIFSNEEYLRAWIVILMEVNHSDSKTLISGKLMDCMRGDSLKSLDTWGKLFGGWSKNRVYRFFNLLKKDNMIEMKNETVTTRLTVCNYDEYQGSGNGVGTGAEQETEPKIERTRNTNKNVKNEKKDKKQSQYSESFERFWSVYPVKRAKKAAYRAWKKATDKPDVEQLISIIEKQNQSEQWRKGFIPHPATWINGGSWEDETDAQQSIGTGLEILGVRK